jgi:hypothetical protein
LAGESIKAKKHIRLAADVWVEEGALGGREHRGENQIRFATGVRLEKGTPGVR